MQIEEKTIYQNDDDVAVEREERRTYKQIPIKINKEFSQYLELKYNKNENAINVNEQKEFEIIFQLGVVEAKRQLFSGTSSLLHKGRRPRRDVWEKLGRIAKEFLDCNTYPKIPSLALSKIINKALGSVVPRVFRDYRKTVLLYCNINEEIIDNCNDSRLGEIDVTFFVSSIPKQFIAVSSTSSFSKITLRIK